MKIIGALLALSLCLLAADVAVAADEVMLKDGTTAIVEVVETTPTSIKVSFATKSGAKGQATLKANAMDPINFYGLRRKHMEKTAENHAKLAIFCFSIGDFNRAKRQWDLAVNLDPELVEKLKEKPDIVEKIAAAIYGGIEDFEKQGEIEKAHEVASRLVAKIPNAPSSEKARQWLAKNEAEYDAYRAAEEQKKENEIAEAEAEEEKEHLEAMEKVLKPIRKMMDKGHKLNATGLQQKSSSKSKSAYNAAAHEYLGASEKASKAKKKKDVEPALAAELDKLEKTSIQECVTSYINAANVDLGQGNTSGARKSAEKALAVDPDNARAKDVLMKAEMASSDKFYLDDVRSRRGARAPGRGGGGRR